jgi:NAD(P)-dependent dehydrogenase (short-subunit alcohol dehydrogenase family)
MTDSPRVPDERDPETIWTPPEAFGGAPGRARLAGRNILVVGAGSQPCDDEDAPIGNGRAIAILAAREGARVACVDRDEDAAFDTLRRIESEGGDGSVIVADVTQESACAQLVVEAEESLGGLDGIVVNVGIGYGRGLESTDARMWDQTFATNLRAHFLIARAALPHLGAGGAFVFISSIASLKPGTSIPAYDASKAGLAGLCRHVAYEGARQGVRANLVTPGLIDTPLGRLASRGRPSRGRTSVPLGRQGTGWEVAYSTVFLLSGEASYITGQQIVVDGGLSALR